MNISSFLPVAQVRSGASPSPLDALWPMVLIFVIFYFLIFRPQKQKQEELKKMVSSLDKNADVITIGGIHGTIVNVKQDTVTLRIADNVKIEVQKSAIAGLRKDKPETGIQKQ